MTQKIINIGVEGNDATGDAIRDSFNKVNENFYELYSFITKGNSGGIPFTSLSDYDPNQDQALVPNSMFIVNATGKYILAKELYGSSETGIGVDYTTDPTKIILTNKGAKVSQDSTPSLGGSLDGKGLFSIGNILDPDSSSAINAANSFQGPTGSAGIDSFVITKGYGDRHYLNIDGDTMTGALTSRSQPTGPQIGVTGYDATLTSNYLSTEVMQRKDVVYRGGDTLTGPLTLNANPTVDLHAATKNYVDISEFPSTVDLFVSTNGRTTAQMRYSSVPTDRVGRALAYAFSSVSEACKYAEDIVYASSIEPGNYKQPITVNAGASLSTVYTVGTATNDGVTVTRLQITNLNGTNTVDQGNPSNLDLTTNKLIVGGSSGAVGTINKYWGVVSGYDLIDIQGTIGTFQTGENLYFDQATPKIQVAIYLESGIYEEHLPIRVPKNVSIIGSEMRRTIIRPKDAASASPWRSMYFYRDPVIDGLTTNNTAIGNATFSGTIVGSVLTVTSAITGTIAAGQFLTGANGNITASVSIASGSGSSWVLNNPYNVSVSVAAPIVATTGYGYYYLADPTKPLDIGPGYAVFSGSISGGTLTVATGTVTGTITVGQVLSGSGISSPIKITGGSGLSWTISNPSNITVNSQTIYSNINAGGYNNTSTILSLNSEFMQAEVYQYMLNYAATNSLSNTFDKTKSQRDVGLVISAICDDLIKGDTAGVVNAAYRFYNTTVYTNSSGYRTVCKAGLDYLKQLIPNILSHTILDTYTTTPFKLNTDSVSQNSAVAYIAESNLPTVPDGVTVANALVDIVSYSLSNSATFNPPRNNKDIDMFLMNDATGLKDFTIQGHGGFATVLDPEGQILTKSPYIQNCSSISASVNAKAFRGGALVDGYSGRIPVTITTALTQGTPVTQITVSGLTFKQARPLNGKVNRVPGTPTAFYVNGLRYRIDKIVSFTDSTGTAVLQLGDAYSSANTSIVLETAGNKSMLATHFTQVNDIAYGIMVTNNALMELVSVFTYYCHTAYYSINGGQIRAVSGSNSNGFFGLKAEGSDPGEVPRYVTLADNLTQYARIYKKGSVYNGASYNAASGSLMTIVGYDYVPYSITEIQVYHPVAGKTTYTINNISPVVNSASISMIAKGGTGVGSITCTTQHGFSTSPNGGTPQVTNVTGSSGSYTITLVSAVNNFTSPTVVAPNYNIYQGQIVAGTNIGLTTSFTGTIASGTLTTLTTTGYPTLVPGQLINNGLLLTGSGVTYNIRVVAVATPGATFTGSISGTTLTISASPAISGTVSIGQTLSGTGITGIVSISSGSALSWVIKNPNNISVTGIVITTSGNSWTVTNPNNLTFTSATLTAQLFPTVVSVKENTVTLSAPNSGAVSGTVTFYDTVTISGVPSSVTLSNGLPANSADFNGTFPVLNSGPSYSGTSGTGVALASPGLAVTSFTGTIAAATPTLLTVTGNPTYGAIAPGMVLIWTGGTNAAYTDNVIVNSLASTTSTGGVTTTTWNITNNSSKNSVTAVTMTGNTIGTTGQSSFQITTTAGTAYTAIPLASISGNSNLNKIYYIANLGSAVLTSAQWWSIGVSTGVATPAIGTSFIYNGISTTGLGTGVTVYESPLQVGQTVTFSTTPNPITSTATTYVSSILVSSGPNLTPLTMNSPTFTTTTAVVTISTNLVNPVTATGTFTFGVPTAGTIFGIPASIGIISGATLSTPATATLNTKIAKISLGTGIDGASTKFTENMNDGDFVVLRTTEIFKFYGNFVGLTSRPSTALDFTYDGISNNYRTVALSSNYYNNSRNPGDAGYGTTEALNENPTLVCTFSGYISGFTLNVVGSPSYGSLSAGLILSGTGINGSVITVSSTNASTWVITNSNNVSVGNVSVPVTINAYQGGTSLITIDSNYSYVTATVTNTAAIGGATTIRINELTDIDKSRIVGMEFGWVDQNVTPKGYTRTITAYTATSPGSYATLTLNSALPTNTIIPTGVSISAGIKSYGSSTISSSISGTGAVNTIVMASNSTFSYNGTYTRYVRIDSEIFSFTGISSTTTLTGVNRAQLGTVAAVHSTNAVVQEISGLLTANISTNRVTSHDFLNIGTGGYNTSNYPNSINGVPYEAKVDNNNAVDSVGSNTKAEVQEKNRGRVFFAATNQDGFFRVGRFFTVDQGTGTVSFSASIVLSGLTGLGFKSGVFITQFLNDATMPDIGDAVPTMSSVREYVNRRLGVDLNGTVSTSPIGSGFLPLQPGAGVTMKGTLDMGTNKIANVVAPSSGTDAANKSYVDQFLKLTGGTRYEIDLFVMGSTSQIAIATFARTGTTATIVTSQPNALSVGSIITISGLTDTSFNTTTTVTGIVSLSSFTYTTVSSTTVTSTPGGAGVVTVPDSIGMNSNKITNVGTPTDTADASTKGYVDTKANVAQLGDVLYTTPTGPTGSDMMVYSGTKWVNTRTAGDVVGALSATGPTGNILTYTIQSGAVVDSKVSATAAIDHTKLSIDNANASYGETITITGISGNGTTVTVTFSSPLQLDGLTPITGYTFPVGSRIVIAGVTGITGYNGTYIVSGATTNSAGSSTITYSSIISGVATLTTATIRSLRGAVSLDANQFTVSTGFASIKSNSLKLDRLLAISGNTVVGNSTAGAATPTAINFTAVVDGALAAAYSIPNSSVGTGVLTRLGSGQFGTITYSSTVISAQNLVSRDSSGNSTFGTVTAATHTTGSNTTAGTLQGLLTVDGNMKINIVSTDSVGQLSLGAGNGATGRISKIKFNSTFYSSSDTNERYTASIRSGFDSSASAWGSEYLGIYINNVVNDAGLDSNQTLAAKFTKSGLSLSGTLKRTASGTGYLDGNYNGGGEFVSGSLPYTATSPGPIYSLGNGIAPTATNFGNMVGIGFCYTAAGAARTTLNGSATGIATASTGLAIPDNLWGQYVVINGGITIFLGTDGIMYGTAAKARYADLAENYAADQKYEPGTVLMIGGEQEVTLAKGEGTRKVAGVVSTNPAYHMNMGLETEFPVALALQGRVPCKVIGKIEKGDMMVVSMVPGVAMASEDPKAGSIIGKALANYDSDRVGVIEVLVGKH